MLKLYSSIYKEMAVVGPSYKGLQFKVIPRNHGKENFHVIKKDTFEVEILIPENKLMSIHDFTILGYKLKKREISVKELNIVLHKLELPMKNPKGKVIEPILTNYQSIKALGASLEGGN
jgi:hypothetical protein